jgi:hypothetical protein
MVNSGESIVNIELVTGFLSISYQLYFPTLLRVNCPRTAIRLRFPAVC